MQSGSSNILDPASFSDGPTRDEKVTPDEKGASDNPATRLGEILKEDMRATNQLIIDRLDSQVPLIPQIASYIIAAGGKRLRPLLTLACARLFAEANMDKAYLLASAVEFVHTATLLHDDVVDESPHRRGQEASHMIYGNETTVLVGDFLFARSFELMVETGHIEVLDILSKAAAAITEGEVKQLAIARKIDSGIDDYLQVVDAKTSALFAAACSVGAVISGDGHTPENRQALHDYGINLGVAFQISDDILDFRSDQKTLGKTIGNDFREGKMTLPIILAVEHARILAQTTGQDENLKFWQRVIEGPSNSTDQDFDSNFAHALKIMEADNIFDKAANIARDYADKAVQCLNQFPEDRTPKDKFPEGQTPSVRVRQCLADLPDYCIRRLS